MTIHAQQSVTVPTTVPFFEVLDADGMKVMYNVWVTQQVQERPTGKAEVTWAFEYAGLNTVTYLIDKLGWDNFATAARGGVVAAKYGTTGKRLWYFVERMKNKKKPNQKIVNVKIDFS